MYFEAALSGLGMVVAWPALGYLGLGIILGLFFGAVPGLSGLVGMAILLPFTIGMDTASAFAFLIGMYAVTTTSDTLASVLLGVPGTAASQATILDGYPLAQKGEAARALGAAFTVSGIGGLLGALMLALSIPIVEPIILAISEPEFLVLGVLGMTMVGALAGSSMLKGLTAACLGLLLATVGYAEFSGQPRYTFGFTYLLDGIPILPLVLGLFAIPEIIDLAVSNSSISRVKRADVRAGMLRGIRDAFVHWWLGLRCTVIGVYVGMLPGLGGAIVDWVAYGHAVQSSRDKSQFGKGDIRGVIAPEAANNAMKGGALLPTIAFAIPGSASMAILLGAFTIQGLQPGPQMLISQLDVTFSLVWALALANVAGAVALLIWGNQISKLTFVKGHILVPAVMLFIFMGSWIERGDLGDWILLLAFGLLGYCMKKGGWARPPLVLGFILGKIMESALHLSIQTHGAASFSRPIVIVLIGLLVLTVFVAIRRSRAQTAKGNPTEDSESEGGAVHHPAISLPLSLMACATFAAAAVVALGWTYGARLFPIAIIVAGGLLSLLVLVGDTRNLAIMRTGGHSALRPIESDQFRGAVSFAALLIGVLLSTLVLGQYVSLIIFVAIYLQVWGQFDWRIIALYSAVSAIGLYGLFQVIVPVIWYPSPFFTLF
ncbi:MAG: tripartite tricarboxylate transporter permease [Pseudomonadota bacterium]